MPPAPVGQPAGPEQVAGRMAGVFGDLAPLVERLEFTPTPSRAPREPDTHPRPAPPTPDMTEKMAGNAAVLITAGDEAVRGRKGPDHPGGGRRVD